MKVYDEVLQREEIVHEKVTPQNGVELILNEPESMKKVFDEEVDDD